jgi:hypothetical protein
MVNGGTRYVGVDTQGVEQWNDSQQKQRETEYGGTKYMWVFVFRSRRIRKAGNPREAWSIYDYGFPYDTSFSLQDNAAAEMAAETPPCCGTLNDQTIRATA